jgi:hypothetical protein
VSATTPTPSEAIRALYAVTDNSYVLTAKDDERDRIATEIGDTKQPEIFYPQMKVCRWDNECNFSIRLVDEGEAKVSEDGDRIKWACGSREARFYPLSDAEGGYEFEITLLERPKSNTLNFTLQTKGIEAYYQPALTTEEIAAGAFRPEHIVGSYAIYHDSKAGNFADRHYRAGKMGHIYRPQVIDAAGKTAWGDLNIDLAAGTLTVTIPAEFLDSATYPIRHAAGLTFGYESAGGTEKSALGSDFYGSKYTCASAGEIDSITAYVRGLSRYFKPVVCNSSKAILANGVGPESEDCTNADNWLTVNYTSKPTVSAADFFLGMIPKSNYVYFHYDASAGTSLIDSSNDYTTPTDPSDGTDGTDKYSIYATYTASGGSHDTVTNTAGLTFGGNLNRKLAARRNQAGVL